MNYFLFYLSEVSEFYVYTLDFNRISGYVKKLQKEDDYHKDFMRSFGKQNRGYTSQNHKRWEDSPNQPRTTKNSYTSYQAGFGSILEQRQKSPPKNKDNDKLYENKLMHAIFEH